MEKKSPYIDSLCIKKLLAQGRIPLLFIGSGLSKRYLQNYPSWEELVIELSEELGISKGQILAMKQEITDENPSATKSKIFAEIGSNLTKIFREKVLNGDIKLEDVFSKEEISDIEKNNTTFIKMLISKKLGTYELSTNKKYTSELTEFKKLQNNIGAVVTTNYDQFLEKEIFTNFDVFVEQSQYYMTDCTGIGEIYKIHGSIDSPNSIIFNTEDYENFNNNLKVIAAKLLNLALDYPIIFIGYSLEDENILKILETLVDSLNDNQLKNLSKNLVYVEWKHGEKRLWESKKTITREGKSLELTCISTDNYFVLYKHLSKFIPAEKPERVRKYKKMIKNLILKNNSGETAIIAAENLDKTNNDGQLVVAFAPTDYFANIGIVGITADNIIKWVLEQKKDISSGHANAIFKNYYETTRVQSNHFVPMFYLEKFTNINCNTTKLLGMKNNLEDWVEKLENSNIPLYNSYKEIKNNPDNLATYKYIQSIVLTYHKNNISYKECLELLVELNNVEPLIKNTDFRKAVTYLDLKQKKPLN